MLSTQKFDIEFTEFLRRRRDKMPLQFQKRINKGDNF